MAKSNKQRCAEWYAKNRTRVVRERRDEYAANRESEREAGRKRYAANPERWKANSRRLRGIPEPTRPMPGRCECCNRKRGERKFHIDHCHESGRFRGWLCSQCNVSIGGLGDTVEGLLRAIEYLVRS